MTKLAAKGGNSEFIFKRGEKLVSNWTGELTD